MNTTMEYITEGNRIYVIANGEEVGEVTFPESEKGVYVINHTYVDDRLRGRWKRLNIGEAGWRLPAVMRCCGWPDTAATTSATHLSPAQSTKPTSVIRPAFQATSKY